MAKKIILLMALVMVAYAARKCKLDYCSNNPCNTTTCTPPEGSRPECLCCLGCRVGEPPGTAKYMQRCNATVRCEPPLLCRTGSEVYSPENNVLMCLYISNNPGFDL